MTIEDVIREIVREEIAAAGLVAANVPMTAAEKILADVARIAGVTVEELTGPSKARHLHQTRIHAYQALRLLGWSYPVIGARFNRDHSTIMAALR